MEYYKNNKFGYSPHNFITPLVKINFEPVRLHMIQKNNTNMIVDTREEKGFGTTLLFS